jgi:hypothetical protein
LFRAARGAFTPYRTLVPLLALAAIASNVETAGARPDSPQEARLAKDVRRASDPLTLVVSLNRQRVTVYEGMNRIAQAPISSGRQGYPTPTGIFTILQKNRIHYSNLYDSAPMPFMQRLTWSGVALHAGHLPGYPDSHGCIRLPAGFARELFALTRLGTRVIVARDDVAPLAIAHAGLPAPLPSAAALAAAGEPTPPFPAPAEGSTAATGASQAGMVLTAVGANGRTRETVAAARAAERQRLASAVAAAEAERAEALARAREAAAAAHKARNAVRSIRIEAELLAGNVEKARRELAAAEAQLADLIRRNAAAAADPGAAATLGEREETIEARVLDAIAEVEAAEAEAAEHQAEIEPRMASAAAAERERVALVNALAAATDAIEAAQVAQSAAERLEAQRKLPITAFISRKTGRLYVRQGFEPLLDTPVTVDRPDAPIGTHVFTALELEPGERALRWSVVSTSEEPRETTPAVRPRAAEPAHRTRSSPAAAALDRIAIPEEALEVISEHIKPGSSLIISDHGVGNETGKFTDIIVQTR